MHLCVFLKFKLFVVVIVVQPFPPRAPTSPGTVLCFDTSASIGQQGLQEMKRQALDFIDGTYSHAYFGSGYSFQI